MESRSAQTGNVTQPVRTNDRPRWLTAEEIIAGRRRLVYGIGERKAGMIPGTFRVLCDLCRGAGTVKFGTRPMEVCHKCEGAGQLTIKGEREGDSLSDMWHTMRMTILWLAISALVAVAFVAILLWRSNAWKP